MKLLIATPCYGGQLYSSYAGSMVSTVQGLTRSKVQFDWFFMSNESLIPRARNKCMHYALTGGYDKLMFIDADISWTWKDLERLLVSRKNIVGGNYPLKKLPLKANYIPYPDQMPNQEGEVEVEYLATGFMLINLKMVRNYCDSVKRYPATDSRGTTVMMGDFFPSGPTATGYESEDWGFCTLMRKHDITVWLNANVTLPHTGTYTFDLNDPFSQREQILPCGNAPKS
jgi:hypothetical protein